MQRNEEKQEIAQNEIKNIRQSLGLTQEQFGAQIGVSKLTIARWEGGERACKGPAAKRIRELQQKSNLSLTPTTSLTSILPEDLSRLDSQSAIETLRELLVCEARRIKMPVSAIDISPEEISDGGVDCRVRLSENLSGSFLNSGATYFQVKSGATDTPWQKSWVQKELFGKSKPELEGIGEEVLRCLQENGRYILVFFGIHLTPQQSSKATDHLKTFFNLCGFSNVHIEVWSQDHLKGFISPFPSLALKLKGGTDLEFQSVSSWHANHDMSLVYHHDINQEPLINNIRTTILDDKISHIKLLGEPGIGKTRVALEAVKTKELEPYTLYVSNAEKFINSKLYNQLLRTDNGHFFILVLDGCSPQISRQVWNALRNRSERCKIISISNEKYMASDEKEIIFNCPQVTEETLSKIITSYTGEKSDTGRWINLCTGSPSVAHMLGHNLKKNPTQLLNPLSHKDLWESSIANGKQLNSPEVEKKLIVLRHIALFHKFGFEDFFTAEANEIYNLIERNSGLRAGEIQSIIKNLQNQNLLKGKKTLFITPKALHIQLWIDYWENYGRLTSIKEILNNRLTDQMKEWFIQMLPFAHKSEVAAFRVREFLTPNSGHFDIEFLASPLGCQMLNSLSEAIPNNVLNTIEEIFGKFNKENLFNFKNGRQHIVNALEKLAIYPNLFKRSAQILLKLAEAENASHSNNARGTFINLFSLAPGLVAPTGASPIDRLVLLKEALLNESTAICDIALLAFRKALSHPIHSGFRIVGAEYHGLHETLSLWTPSSNEEYQLAYTTTWKLLNEMRTSVSAEIRSKISAILIESSQYLLYFGWMDDLIIQTLYSLLDDDSTNLNQLLDMISTTLKYRNGKIASKALDQLRKIDEKITGNDLTSRIKRFVLYSGHHDFFNRDGKSKKKFETLLRLIARDCHKKKEEFISLIPSLVKSENWILLHFGYELSKLDKKKSFLALIIESYKTHNQEASYIFIAGYLKAIFESHEKKWNSLVKDLIEDRNFLNIIGPTIRNSGFNDFAIEQLIISYDKKTLSIENLLSVYHSSEMKKIKTENVTMLAQRFSECQKIKNAIDLIHYVFCNSERENELPEVFTMQLLNEYCISGDFSDTCDHCSNELAEAVIRNNHEKQNEIFEIFINRSTNKNGYMGPNNPIYKTIHSIIKTSPNFCWKVISSKLESHDSLLAWRVALLFNSLFLTSNQFPTETNLTLNDFSQETILNWVAESPNNRAKLIAKMIPATLQIDTGWLGRELLNRYGDQEEVQQAMIEKFFTGSWSGSESNYFKAKKEIAQEWLKNENSQRIKNWIEKYIDILSHHLEESSAQEEREL